MAARDYRLTANTTAFTLSAPGPGFAVLQESWLDGDFQVTLNGSRVPYFRVNHAFKGIAIPTAGEYRVVVTYWPRHLTAALWAAGLGLAIFITLMITTSRSDPPASSPRLA